MSALNPKELADIYSAVLRGSGHPDPIGLLMRAIEFSGANPDYLGSDGRLGFVPVSPDAAASAVGATEVQTLMGNLRATIAMDLKAFTTHGSLSQMVYDFHSEGIATSAVATFVEGLDLGRDELYTTMFPPKATVADVIKALTPDEAAPTEEQIKFYKSLGA